MLSRWFRRSSRLEHKDASVRLQAIAALTDETAQDAQALLQTMAAGDDDLDVRQAAVAKLLNADAMAPLLADAAVASSAAKRIAHLIKTGQTSSCGNHELVLAERINAAEAEDIASLWADLSLPEHCANLALRLRDEARAQVLEHPLLNNEAGLAVLLRQTKGKDKSCHRHARDKLELIKTARQDASTLKDRIAELDQSISKARQGGEPRVYADLIAHRQKLSKLRDMRQEVAVQLASACTTLEASGGAAHEFMPPPDPIADLDLSIPAAADSPFTALENDLNELDRRMREGAAIAAVATARDTLTAAWLTHADRFPPSDDQHRRFAALSRQFNAYQSAHQRLASLDVERQPPAPLGQNIQAQQGLAAQLSERKRWLKRWQKPIGTLQWPADHQPPELLSVCAAELERVRSESQQLQDWFSQASTELTELIDTTNKAMDAGQIDAAQAQMRKIRALQKAGISSEDQAIAQLSAQLAEFRDWQKFATDPKRDELLAQMQQLSEAPLEAPAQAAKIKQLRSQWQALGRPSSAHDAGLQQQFNEFAEAAFAPCRVYFDAQAEQRATNLAARQNLCQQLSDYLEHTDWATADMAAAETIMRSARQEWHTFNPCDRRALKPVQDQFEALQDALHAKVKASWHDNVGAKQALVEQAQQLLVAPLDEQIQGAKDLQNQWRQIGRTPRGPDQRLWREFRQICDQIFAQREAAFSAEKAAQNAQYEALEAAVVNFERAAAAEFDHTRKTLSDMLSDIDSLGAELNVAPALKKRISTARRTYEQALDKLAVAAEAEALNQWQQWDEVLSQAEQNGTPIEAPQHVFKARAQGQAEPVDWLRLTLEAEIAADITSPAADQNIRMALQVELMNEGRRNLAAEDYKNMRDRWCAAGPKDAAADALRERFFTALKARL